MLKKNFSLTEGPILSAVIKYTVPIILTSVLQLLFNAADLVVVGRFCGSSSVAAVGATGSLTTLLVNFFIGLSIGSGVAVAQAYGAHDTVKLHKTIHTAITTSLVAGTILTVIGVSFSKEFLILMDTPANILPKSTTYMKIHFGGIIFSMVYNYSASILRALGDTQRPLIYLSIAGVVNVVLNVIFVTVFDLDVAGVSLATTISQGVSAVLVTLSLMHRTDEARLFLRELRVYKDELIKVLSIGIPAGIQSSVFAASNVIVQSSVNSFGDVFMSGNAAAANIEGFVYTTMNSFAQTSVNFVGQNYGAKNFKRIKQILITCLVCVTFAGALVGGIARAFAPQLLSIYITDSSVAINAGLIRMSYICQFYFLCGIMDVITGAIRGFGASMITMFLSIFGVVIMRIGWIFTVFAKHHTPETLYVSYPISWITTIILQLIAFIIVYRIKKKKTDTVASGN